MRARTLVIPVSLVVSVAAWGASGCGPSGSSGDSGASDVAAQDVPAGMCTLNPPPAGRTCETTCYYAIGMPPLTPRACEVYCERPDGGSDSAPCYNADGTRSLCSYTSFDGPPRPVC